MKKIYLLFFSISAFALQGVNGQTTVNIVADKDNTIYSEGASKSNGVGDYFFAGVTAGGNIRRALLHFDLSAIPATAVVTSVTLKLNANKFAASSTGIEIKRLSSNWGEGASNANGQEGSGANAVNGDATWVNNFFSSTSWTTAGGDFFPATSGSIANVSDGANNLTQTTGGQLVADVQTFVTTPSSNSGWIIFGSNEGTNQSAIRFKSKDNPDASDRPLLSVTYTNVLPITLGYFNAKLLKGDAILGWETISEINNAFFDIEHSSNGQVFLPVGRINGNGTTVLKQQYSFTHTNIPAGKNFYRIAQYDNNGSKSYSRVVVLSTYGDKEMELYPNPSYGLLNINTPFIADRQPFRIENFSGQSLKSGKISGTQLRITDLPAGIYILSVQTPDGIWLRSKFIKD